jgi:hypothetical protein
MFPADIQNFTFLPSYTQQDRKWFFTIIAPSDEDIGKLLETRKDNTLRLLCCYKSVDDMKVPYLQGGLIFKNHMYDRVWLKNIYVVVQHGS